MKLNSSKFFVTFIVLITVYLFLSYALFEVWSSWKSDKNAMSSVALPYVVVHIDLKGAPPKMEYLLYLLPILKDHGVNALLMEYEDMFPYEGKLAVLSSKNCYNRSQLNDFLTAAALLSIEIIPLIQTFGHLEYALKLDQFRQLRERPTYPDSICPSNEGSKELVTGMLEQVVNFHNNIVALKHIHVGFDEVFFINQCDLCKSRGLTSTQLFVNYMRYITGVMTKLSPDTTVLIWDDMFRKLRPYTWTKIDCFNHVEPVYWNYTPKPNIDNVSMNYYHMKFTNIWVASAFKGADGPTATIPNLNDRVKNNFEWMNFLLRFKMAGEKKIFGFKGIILTGWSRYNHMRPLTELLPIAIPSLMYNLRMIQKYKSGQVEKFDELDNFYDRYISEYDKYFTSEIISFRDVNLDFYYKGDALYKYLIYYMYFMKRTYSDMYKDNSFSPAYLYYSENNRIDLFYLNKYIDFCNNTLNEINKLEQNISLSMNVFFDDYVVNEYLGYKFNKLRNQMSDTLNTLQQLVKSYYLENGRYISTTTR